MDTLATARSLMALSLAFHIVFAVIGMAMPVLMVVSEGLWLRTGDPVYLDLTKRWARGTAVCFAVGAMSGTVLSFELGLLWPWFMAYAGAIIGMPFSLEGFAFFLEAIFLGIYLYGWQRVRPTTHLFAGIVVALSGALSGVFVISANAWMNTPTGFRLVNGMPTDIDPLRAMMNPAAAAEIVHMLVAAYAALGFAVAGIHARMLLSKSRSAFHSRALIVALLVGAPAAIAQPFAGDFAARVVARTQPVKLAAMEGQFETRRGAPLHIGGWPDPDSATMRFALEIPGGLSWLAYGDPHALVAGLEDVPRTEWPPVRIVHVAFQNHGRDWRRAGSTRDLGRGVDDHEARVRPGAEVPSRAGRRDTAGVHRHRGGVGRHRGGTPALDHHEVHAHVRRGDVGSIAHGVVRGVHGSVRPAGGDRRHAAPAAGDRGARLMPTEIAQHA